MTRANVRIDAVATGTGIGKRRASRAAAAKPAPRRPRTRRPNGTFAPVVAPVDDLRDPALYINRELSSLAYIDRVLDEAMDERNPLLERVKFLSIVSTMLDEFYMTRVAGLRDQLVTNTIAEAGRDGLTPHEQLTLIKEQVRRISALQREHLEGVLRPRLAAAGVLLLDYDDLPEAACAGLQAYFDREVFPVLTPLAVDAARPFPHISSLSLNLLVVIRDETGERVARVKVPPVLDRLVRVAPPATPGEDGRRPAAGGAPQHEPVAFTWLEQVIAANLGSLFPGKEIVGSYFFRVTRNADLAIREAEAEDLLEMIEASLERRPFGFVVRVSVNPAMPPARREWLAEQLEIEADEVQVIDGPLGFGDLMSLYRIDRPDLKYPPFVPQLPPDWSREGDIFQTIARRDVLLHHPYDSFTPVVDFIRSARDPHVLAVKQTLYRVGANSPVVEALLEARGEEKQVAATVELKASFDEESNIVWARALEHAGVHVAYGLLGLKTHCKMALIVRKELDGLHRYAHLGTGNYNASTARGYTDFGLLTADPDICADVSDVFNYLTGYSAQRKFRKLLVAPANLRARLVQLIEREAAFGEKGRLIFKMNALVDAEMVEALYRAARAGVQIDLIVRGACSLRPGVPGVSETIRVISIIGRFLEHSRAYYFRNGGKGKDELYLGSADLMPRNLNRRVEVLFPLESPPLKAHVRDDILPLLLRDNVKARVLQPDGVYHRRRPAPGEPEVNSQEVLLAHASALSRP